MRKAIVLALVAAVALGGAAYANKESDEGMEKAGAAMWAEGTMVKAENTTDGARILITTNDPKNVKAIQESAAMWADMHAKMMKEGSLERKMSMMSMDRGLHKKLGMVLGFMKVIWSLIILLIAATIVLVIKKIIRD